MSDLQQRFEEMLEKVRNATIDFSPSNAQKLKLYAFYKQATEGDVIGECPSVVNIIERAKWQAWNAIKGMTKEKSMESYLKVFSENK
ncbi:MAG TPA: acyl-CoA-binding protein [Burkholderiales bacterium]|nr:acyl-CoA-binding protein [Burkholderiales bacterium]